MSREETIALAEAISTEALAVPSQSHPYRRNFKNLTNYQFSKLTVIDYVGIQGRLAAWRCVCDCGNYCIVLANKLLTNGKTQCIACHRLSLSTQATQRHEDNRVVRLPNLYSERDSKACCECKQVQPLAEFTRRRKEPDGLAKQCRTCLKNRKRKWTEKNLEHVRETNRSPSLKYAENHPERKREAMMKCKYGIGVKEYHKLLEQQNDGCAICGAPPTVRPHSTRATLCIDHDHSTGRIRGLLCSHCNHAIGLMQDDPILLEKAAEYLKR